MQGQDWQPVTIGNKRNATATATKGTATKGTATKGTATVKGPNFSADYYVARKVDEATVPVKLKSLSPESRQALIAARVALKMTQIDVNQRASFATHSIRDFESGRTTPSHSQLSILNRILKTNLKLT
jgi:ribosome-binding protein aMBF1 (putative translation factor)